MDVSPRIKPSYHIIILLILAGEAVFILPFVLARVFRPTFLDVFDLNNLQLGYCFSIYGIVALLSYLFGGPIADKVKPNKLMSLALILTALGGMYFATFPQLIYLKILYGYWGFTTIFLFWAAMIKATRIWGGETNQGKAFGFLDGGRGLVGASFGLLGVLVFSSFISSEISESTLSQRKEAFQSVILISSVIIIFIGIVVWFFLKPKVKEESKVAFLPEHKSFSHFTFVLKLPSVWLLMIIILCAYTGYKTTDIFSLYASDVMLYDQIQSAQIGTLLLYIRPIVGVTIGFLADVSKPTKMLCAGFILMIIGSSVFASGILSEGTTLYFILSMIITAIGVYAARVLYFAVLREGRIPLIYTGTAVGVISVVGYTPDIFAGPMMGYLLDNSPGELGHQHVFLMLVLISIIGLIASILFLRYSKKDVLSK